MHAWTLIAPPACLRSTFATHNKLKKEAMKVIAAGMPADEIAGLRSIFKAIDADGSGTITADELREALKQKGSMLKKVGAGGLVFQGAGSVRCADPSAATRRLLVPGCAAGGARGAHGHDRPRCQWHH